LIGSVPGSSLTGREATGARSDGSVAVESVVLVPIAMVVVLLVVQICLWAHAATLVQAAATTGEQVATAFGGSSTAGQSAAQTELSLTAAHVIVDPSVRSRDLTGGVVEISVSGTAEAILPWLHLPVSATRDGIRQEFRESG
jgi:TadE-like protein